MVEMDWKECVSDCCIYYLISRTKTLKNRPISHRSKMEFLIGMYLAYLPIFKVRMESILGMLDGK